VSTEDHTVRGDHTFEIEVSLADWPDVPLISLPLDVKITHICQSTKLLPPEQYYLIHSEKEQTRYEVLDEFSDRVSEVHGNRDGLSVCGPRIYSIEFQDFERLTFDYFVNLRLAPGARDYFIYDDFLKWDVWEAMPGSPVRNAKLVETYPKVKLQLQRMLFLNPDIFGRQNVTYTASLEHFEEVASSVHSVQIHKFPDCNSDLFNLMRL